jgi:hypothetical protein
MILHLFDRVANRSVSHRKVQGVRRRPLKSHGLACPELLEGRALLAGVVLPNLPAGSKYQIAFVTASVRQAGSTDIANYNAYASGEASANKSLPATTWRAWVSTPTTNARDNAPTYDGVPIYNTRGELIATNKSEFLAPKHRAGINYDQFGIRTDREVWTGSGYQGLAVPQQSAGSPVVQFGRSWDIGTGGNWSSVDYAYAVVNPAGGTTPSGAISLYALSNVLTVGGATTAPSAPSGLVALPGNASVALSWTVPSSVGDSAISDYKVQYSSNGGTNWTEFTRTASNTTSATVAGLTNGVPYVFRVSAVNRAGAGAFTAPSAQAIPLLPSSSPSGVVLPNLPAGSKYQIAFVTASVRQAGSTDIANYNAYVSGQASANKSLPAATWRAWVSTGSATGASWVNARDNAPTYDNVPIYNTRGQLIATNSWEFFSPTHRAGINYDQFGIRTDREVWTGSDYRGMGVYAQTAGSALVQRGRSWDMRTGGNWSSVDYAYAVVNPAGGTTPSGAISLYALSNVLTVGGATTAPSAPTNLIGTAGNGQVSLTWTAPSSNGGSAITDYKIQHSSNGGTTWSDFNRIASTATSATVTGLTNGKAYVFRVSAVNVAGTGAWSAQTLPVTPRTVATAPTNLVGTAGNGQVSLTWTAPSSNGGSAITDYKIQHSSNGGTTWSDFNRIASTATSATVTGLTNGKAYVFRVAGVNAAGTGAYTAPTLPITPLSTGFNSSIKTIRGANSDIPDSFYGEAVGISLVSVTHAITLRYDDLGVSGPAFIMDIQIGGEIVAAATVAFGLDTRLYLGKPFALEYLGQTYRGAFANGVVVVNTVATAPTNLAGTAGNGQVSLTWVAPSSNGGSAITNYKIQHSSNGGTTWSDVNRIASTATSATVTGLTNGKAYVFRVSAVNGAGTGAWSAQTLPIRPRLTVVLRSGL